MNLSRAARGGLATRYAAVAVVILALAALAAYSALSSSSTGSTTSSSPLLSTSSSAATSTSSQTTVPTSASATSTQPSTSTTTLSSSSATSTSSSTSQTSSSSQTSTSTTSVGTSSSSTSTSTTSTTSTSTSTSSTTSTTTSTSTSTTTTSALPVIPPISLPSSPPTSNSATSVSIGYFANLNHAQAVIGLSDGDFQKFVGPSTTIKTTLFTSGSPEMTALLAGKIQIAYVGPDPAVNAFITSNGTALQIVSGVADGGAVFVVTNASGITSAKDLGYKTFAAPGVGNTQDVALRHYILANGFKTTDQGGNVTVEDTSNANILALMEKGEIDGAWVPEPWGAEIVADSASHIFLNEQSLWPNGFSTTELVVATPFLQAHPDIVKEIVEANLYETYWIQNNPQQAAVELNDDLGNLTGAPIGLPVIQSAMTRLAFTDSPLEASVLQQADNAYAIGDLGNVPPTASVVAPIYNLSFLNSILASYGVSPVTNQGAHSAQAAAGAPSLSVGESFALPAPLPRPGPLTSGQRQDGSVSLV